MDVIDMTKVIKRNYRYNEQFVKNVDDLLEPNGTRRYKLLINLNNSFQNKLLVIMMNPGKANTNISDRTVNFIINHIYSNNNQFRINKIIITNLYVYYEQKSQKLLELIEHHGKSFIEGTENASKFNNNKIIKNEIKKANYIIIAWGKPNCKTKEYNRRVYEILKFLNNITVYHFNGLVNDKYPRHPRSLPNNATLKSLDCKSMLKKFKCS